MSRHSFSHPTRQGLSAHFLRCCWSAPTRALRGVLNQLAVGALGPLRRRHRGPIDGSLAIRELQTITFGTLYQGFRVAFRPTKRRYPSRGLGIPSAPRGDTCQIHQSSGAFRRHIGWRGSQLVVPSQQRVEDVRAELHCHGAVRQYRGDQPEAYWGKSTPMAGRSVGHRHRPPRCADTRGRSTVNAVRDRHGRQRGARSGAWSTA